MIRIAGDCFGPAAREVLAGLAMTAYITRVPARRSSILIIRLFLFCKSSFKEAFNAAVGATAAYFPDVHAAGRELECDTTGAFLILVLPFVSTGKMPGAI